MFGQDKEWRFSFLYSNPGEWYVDAMAQPPEICENRFSPGIYFEAYEQDEEDFYINLGRGRTGNDTREKDDRKYEIGRARIRFNLPYAITDVFTVGTNIDLDLGDVEDGHDLVPIPRFVEGAYGDIIYYVGGNGYLRVDTRDSDYRASRGWYVECGGGARTNFSGSDAADRDLTFYFYDVDVQRYLKLFSIFRSVVVRTRFSKTEPFEGGPRHGVPFYFQPALDEDNALRGYERGRYRDRGALLFNVEYRYPIWDTWDGVVFLDEGQVFRHYEDLTLDGFHWSAGLGARFSGKKGFLFRVQAAFSDEMHPLLLAKMEQVF
jgi:outer membrane protein assembly factor BamA